VIGVNEVSLDVIVQNTGELDADNTILRFYDEDINGTLIRELTVPPLCSAETSGCSNFTQNYNSVNLNETGVIYSVINDDNSIRECPWGNIDAINCFGGPETQVFVVDYTVWRN